MKFTIALIVAVAFSCVRTLPTSAYDKPVSSKLEAQLKLADKNRPALEAALAATTGAEQTAMEFLIANMPKRDLTSLSKDFLVNNVHYACKARAEVPWGAQLPDEIFLNDVAPYASINERRDDWRKDFYDRFMPSVKNCKTPGEAALLLNRETFRQFNVRYSTQRPKADQSPYESAEAKTASCTGLSVLIIDACRAVAVPARMVGVPVWTSKAGGNHSWAEVWDSQWHYIGASESSKLDKGWFSGIAAKADATRPECRIYASSFAPTGTAFPLIWDLSIRYVHACDATPFYTTRRNVKFEVTSAAGKPTAATVSLRLGGKLVAQASGEKSYEFALAGGLTYQAEIRTGDGKEATQEVRLTGDEGQSVKLVAK